MEDNTQTVASAFTLVVLSNKLMNFLVLQQNIGDVDLSSANLQAKFRDNPRWLHIANNVAPSSVK